ncbi:MAG: hypothetical protein Q4E53_07645 [Eubacteriales bacterium]|nr:hypothetical protein [Eubacteriales bacterium]
MEAERSERPGGKSGSQKERAGWEKSAKNRKLNCRRLQEKLKETYSYRMAISHEVGYEH